MASLATLALDRTRRADAVPLSDGSTGSALNDALDLRHPAVGILFHVGATGVVRVEEMDGSTRDIDSTKWLQGSFHLVRFRGVRATGTTIAATAFEIGWARSLCRW